MKKFLLLRLNIISLLLLILFTEVYGTSNNLNGKNIKDKTSGIDSLNMKVIVPAYFDPSGGGYWTRLAKEAIKMPGRLYAIANVNSGPGSKYDSSYESAITTMQADSGKVLGYVHSSYGSRPIADVEADINAWYAFYPSLNGIFIDEQANVSGQESYYSQLYDFIKQKDSTALVVTNPGTNTIPSYLFYNGKRIADVICIFETNQGFNTWSPASWCKNYNRDNFYVITYNTSSSAYVNIVNRAASLNIGWIYCTNDVLPNPYDTLPFYFENFCNYLITGIYTPSSVGQGLITIDGNFNDWANVPSLNQPPNPIEESGDTQDPNADFTNFWVTNDSNNLYISYQVAGTLSSSYFYHVFIQTDTSSNSEYVYNDSASISADFMVENGSLYKYTGTGGSNWAWASISGFQKADSAGRTEFSISLSTLNLKNAGGTIKLIFQDNSATAPYGLMDIAPDNYTKEYYSYDINTTTAVKKTNIAIKGYKLDQNYPNPFNPSTEIKYSLPTSEVVILKVYNAVGQEIATLVRGYRSAGQHTVSFNAASLPSGIYFYSIHSGSFFLARKMVLLK